MWLFQSLFWFKIGSRTYVEMFRNVTGHYSCHNTGDIADNAEDSPAGWRIVLHNIPIMLSLKNTGQLQS